MKNIYKKNNTDPISQAKKNKNYEKYAEEVDLKIRLAEEVFLMRERQGLSQTELAKKVGTTQKIISNIENADVNIGIFLFYRISKALNFNSKNFSRIYNTDN